jgi:hypothetical protein
VETGASLARDAPKPARPPLLAATFVLTLPSTPARATSEEGYRDVEMRDNVFAPRIVRVAVGGTIE